MPDLNERTLAERMAQVQEAARAGERVIPSTGEIIEDRVRENVRFVCGICGKVECDGHSVDLPPRAETPSDTTFTPTPDAPQPEPVIEAVAEVLPTPEPIIVTAPPPQPHPAQPRAEEPKAEPEIETPNRGADAPYAASSMGQIIDMMERGGFSQEAVQAFQALARGMSEIADATQKKQKGSITLKINLTTEGEAFFMEGDFKVTAPKLPRPRTIGWQTDDGRISPTQPRQQIMFGRDVGDYGERNVRPITDARVVRAGP